MGKKHVNVRGIPPEEYDKAKIDLLQACKEGRVITEVDGLRVVKFEDVVIVCKERDESGNKRTDCDYGAVSVLTEDMYISGMNGKRVVDIV